MDERTVYIGADVERQYLLEVYADGHMTVSTRVQSWETWGAPVELRAEVPA